MDMRFHWLRCREAQNQFRFFLAPRQNKLGRLLDQTPLHCPPRQAAQPNPNPAKHHHRSARVKITKSNTSATLQICSSSGVINQKVHNKQQS
jgi:hypothetical protein